MLGATEVAPAGCKPVFTYRASEHPHIKVVTRDIVIADMSNMQQHLEARNLDLELEMKVTTSYMSYHMDMIINHQLARLGMKLCHMSRPYMEKTWYSGILTTKIFSKKRSIGGKKKEHRG